MAWFHLEQTRWIGVGDDQEFGVTVGPIYRDAGGRIVHGGVPVDRARVELLVTGANVLRAADRTGRDGRFAFDRLENGVAYYLKITREGYLERTRDLGTVTRDLDIGDIAIDPVDDDPDDPNDPDDPLPPADSDGDGVPDDGDAFPDDPTETLDTDGDGTGDNADADDDNDGMPDEWELRYGLDPLTNDAAGDPDGDGISNADEYAGGTDPGVFDETSAPAPPILLSPADGAAGLAIAALLETGAFSDSDGDGHRSTRWQIGTHPDFSSLVFDRESSRHLTRLEVPSLVLLGEITYYWRVQFVDDRGIVSPWSEIWHFTTDPWAADANRDGIADAVEFTESSDMDGNGTADQEQADIRCLLSLVGKGRHMGILCPETGGQVECLECIDPASIPETEGRPDLKQMPFGLVNFRLGVPNPGETVRLTIYFSEPFRDPAGWYKYSALEGWLDFSEFAVFSEDHRSVEIEIRDGGPGDIDGVANGVIVDPNGVVAATIGKDDDDDDENKWHVSCFIRSLWSGWWK